MSAGPELYAALAKAQGDAQTIAKSGRNTHHGYDYATLSDYLDVVRPVLAKHGLGVILDVPVRDVVPGMVRERTEEPEAWGAPRYLIAEEWGEKQRALRLGCSVILFHESGQTLQVNLIGEAADASDKRIWKLYTGVRKYALANVLNLATGDDPERDSPEGSTGRSSGESRRETTPSRKGSRQSSRARKTAGDAEENASEAQVRKIMAEAGARGLQVFGGDEAEANERRGEIAKAALISVGAVNSRWEPTFHALKKGKVDAVLRIVRVWIPPEAEGGEVGDETASTAPGEDPGPPSEGFER